MLIIEFGGGASSLQSRRHHVCTVATFHYWLCGRSTVEVGRDLLLYIFAKIRLLLLFLYGLLMLVQVIVIVIVQPFRDLTAQASSIVVLIYAAEATACKTAFQRGSFVMSRHEVLLLAL